MAELMARTVSLDHGIDPAAVGAATGLLWSRHGMRLAGVGVARRIPVGRPDGAAAAHAVLAAIEGDNDLEGAAGTGAVGFGAFPFDRTAEGELVVPEILVGVDADGRSWLTTIGPAGEPDIRAALASVADLLGAGPDRGPQPSEYRFVSTLTPETWRDEVVGRVVERIRSGELDKAVLARSLAFESDQRIDQRAVMGFLAERFATSILFNVEGFLGASPELLVARTGDLVWAHPLAGTAPRGADPETDSALAAGLLESSKDRWEHRITIDWLLDTLLPFCSYVDAEPSPTIVSLANVHHLGTRVEGRLSRPAASVLELVAALHPTPAVGGSPQAEALGLITEIEGDERGLYAGPVGWVDAAGNGAFAVGIRSATIDGNRAKLFAGVGVVADSDPASELAETRAKFQAMVSALCRP